METDLTLVDRVADELVRVDRTLELLADPSVDPAEATAWIPELDVEDAGPDPAR